MREQVQWLSAALSDKDIVIEMAHYCFKDGEVRATDGKLAAGTPYVSPHDFLVPGKELKKVLSRMPGPPTVEALDAGRVQLSHGRFRGIMPTLPPDAWAFPTAHGCEWDELPAGLLEGWRLLRPFVSDNASRPWAVCIAIEPEWMYATTNIALAGVPCKTGITERLLVPAYTIDFVLSRTKQLAAWHVSNDYIAFLWEDGSWLRSAVIAGEFPPSAAALVQGAYSAPQLTPLGPALKAALVGMCALADEAIYLHADHVRASVGNSALEEYWDGPRVPVAETGGPTIWPARYLAPVVEVAEEWGIDQWPRPAPFRSGKLAGLVLGRTS